MGWRFRISVSNWAPFMTGIRMSVTTTSKVRSVMAARAFSPPSTNSMSHSARMDRSIR